MSRWQDLVTASLIGTERAVVPRAEIPGLVPAGNASQDQAAVLLDQAALLTAARRAGRRPDHAEPLPPAAPDPRPVVSRAAGRRLARILGGEHQDLLAEWLTAAAARGLRVPAQLLPALLDRALGPSPASGALSSLRRLVTEAGGSRARWLAWLNWSWQFVLVETPADDAWRVGTTADRREYLAALRARDPGAARDLVMGSWDMAGAGERAMFLSVLADRLEPADEPLLEAALDNRAQEVRAWAAYLLDRLPGSALGRRMAERAVRCLRLEHMRGPRLVIVPPTESDASMRRDGIAPAGRSRLVGEIVTRTPLRTWPEQFGLTPGQIVARPADDWAPALFTAWSRAAVAQDDKEWMTALIKRALTGWRPSAPRPAPRASTLSLISAAEVDALRRLARHADPGLGAPGAVADPGPDAPPAVRDALRVLQFRYEMLKELGHDHGDG